ncbi:MAG: carbamoyltransferase HypF, partial [Desulfosarcinaceae bacterium]
QHHHAHVAACMAEHKLDGPVIGLAFDGTGLGTDHTVWGGEVLLADTAGFERVGCLEPVPMPGSASAIREPWRMGLAYLRHAFGDGLGDLDLPLLKQVAPDKARVVLQMAAQGINAPLTSSLGRLFDGVAAILGLRQQVAYEGQAAIELEMIADGRTQDAYDIPWKMADGCRQISAAAVIRAVVADIQAGLPAYVISRRFHETLIAVTAALCEALHAETGLDRVVLSGGCFQNALLLEGLIQALKGQGLDVYAHRLVPTNDGGISLGQAVVAAAALAGRQSEVPRIHKENLTP